MGTMRVNIGNVPVFASAFDNGPVVGRIIESELTVAASSAEPMINLQWEIFHPDHGTAKLFDRLPSKAAWKCQKFYEAITGLTANELTDDDSNIDIDADSLVGAEAILILGEREFNGKTYKEPVPPFYAPITRTDLLDYEV